MLAQQQYQKYQQNSIMTASPAKLTLMLYNGAIKFCDMAIDAIEKKDVQLAHANCVKAQNIILELKVTLDSKFEISKEINRLYDYITDLLVEGNIYKDKEKLLEARGLIVDFRDMWEKVIMLNK